MLGLRTDNIHVVIRSTAVGVRGLLLYHCDSLPVIRGSNSSGDLLPYFRVSYYRNSYDRSLGFLNVRSFSLSLSLTRSLSLSLSHPLSLTPSLFISHDNSSFQYNTDYNTTHERDLPSYKLWFGPGNEYALYNTIYVGIRRLHWVS
jgi:hypothetical protein